MLSRQEPSNAASIRSIRLGLPEAQIAAITKAHGAVLATRNSGHVVEFGGRVVDSRAIERRLSPNPRRCSPLSISTTRPMQLWRTTGAAGAFFDSADADRAARDLNFPLQRSVPHGHE